VYEAGRELDPNRNPVSDPQMWRIPERYRPVFSGSPGMKCLLAYRSFLDHDADANREDDDKFDRHQKVGKVFMLAIGKVRPDSGHDWGKAQAHLVAALATAAEALLDMCRVEGAVGTP
jgi:hypothetical protein